MHFNFPMKISIFLRKFLSFIFAKFEQAGFKITYLFINYYILHLILRIYLIYIFTYIFNIMYNTCIKYIWS